MFRRVASFRAFSHRSYRTVWAGAFVSNIGNWMQTVALGIFVTQTTGSAGWTGTIAALTYLPALVLGPVGGALADRIDRRTYLVGGTLAQIAFASALAALALTGRLTIPWVALLSFLSGGVTAMLNPAFSALLVDIVPREDLLSAVSLNSAQFNLGRIIGPVLAALAISGGGAGLAFAGNALSFVATLCALALVHPEAVPRSEPEPMWPGIRRGVAAAMADLRIRESLSLTLVVGALVAPFIGLIPVMAIKLLGGGPFETSLLVTSQGVGAVIAATVAGTFAERFGRGRLLIFAAIVTPAVALLYWVAPSLVLACVALLVLGGAYLTCLSSLNTRIQTNAPPELRARIASLYSMLLGGGYALGLGSLGWLGDHFGMRLTGACASGLCLAAVVRVRFVRPASLREAA